MSLFGFKEKNEIELLNKKIDVLNNKVKKLDSDVEYFKFELTLSEEEKEKLKSVIEKKEDEITELETEIKSPHDKQFEKITVAFDQINSENFEIKANNLQLIQKNENLMKDNSKLEEKIAMLEKQIEKQVEELKSKELSSPKLTEKPIAKIKEFAIRYKLLIKDLYSARKYDDFRRICDNADIVYVNDLEDFDFDHVTDRKLSKIKITNARNEFLKFKDNNFDLGTKEYLNSGHPVSKVFFRYRSFVAYLSEININFVSEMESFDFDSLDKSRFTSVQRKKFKYTLKSYNELRKI